MRKGVYGLRTTSGVRCVFVVEENEVRAKRLQRALVDTRTIRGRDRRDVASVVVDKAKVAYNK